MNIKDFKVLLDKRVYHNLEGQWRDLFNRLKWDTVKSALKSVAGLQGRKFKARFLHYIAVHSTAQCNTETTDDGPGTILVVTNGWAGGCQDTMAAWCCSLRQRY